MSEQNKDLIGNVGTSDQIKIRVPRTPHMLPAQVEYFTDCLTQSNCFLEYGAGGSTRLAAKIGVPTIFSVESDKLFAKSVVRKVHRDNPVVTLVMNVPKVGETGKWGRPIDNQGAKGWPHYVLNVWDKVDEMNSEPDLVLVDGRFRIACCIASIIRLRPGVKILFDDFFVRENLYKSILRILEPVSRIEKMAVFETPSEKDYPLLAFELARHCLDPR